MKRLISISLIIACLSAIVLFSSFDIRGNGNVVSKKRDVTSFTSIDVSNGFDVIISQGSDCSVEVEADENLQSIIITKVKGGVLYIYTKENIRRAKKRSIYISFENLKSLKVSGAVDLESAGVINSSKMTVECSGASDVELYLHVGSLRLDVSGASDLELEGETDYLDADVSGASDIDAFQLYADKVIVKASGASNIKVHALSSLEAKSSGASDVIYKGNPTVETISTSGAGEIRRL